MRTFVIRLTDGQDLKEELLSFVKSKNIKAGFIITSVGSLKKAALRLAGAKETKTFNEKFEITSLVGTLSQDGLHLHVALSDKKGNVIGGHLADGCIINTTAEIIIGEFEDKIFSRELDKKTGFNELKIRDLSTVIPALRFDATN